MQALEDFYTSITTKNWFATAALAIMLATQFVNSLPLLRKKIWDKIPIGYRWGLPVVAAALTAFVHGYQAHETAAASIWDAVKIALTAMGGAAALKESPLPWGGGPGGAEKIAIMKAASIRPAPLPLIPPLRDAADDDLTPVDKPPSQPPPPAAT